MLVRVGAAAQSGRGEIDARRLEQLGLSPREVTVAVLAARGSSNDEIGEQLGLSPLTVKKHLERIYERLGIANRTALAAWVWEHAPPRRS